MSADRGALPQLRAATDSDAKGGEFYGPRWVNSGAPVRKPILRRDIDKGAAINVSLDVLAYEPAALRPRRAGR